MLSVVEAAAVNGLSIITEMLVHYFGFDEGCVCIELGSDDPVASMDSTGKIGWATNNDNKVLFFVSIRFFIILVRG